MLKFYVPLCWLFYLCVLQLTMFALKLPLTQQNENKHQLGLRGEWGIRLNFLMVKLRVDDLGEIMRSNNKKFLMKKGKVNWLREWVVNGGVQHDFFVWALVHNNGKWEEYYIFFVSWIYYSTLRNENKAHTAAYWRHHQLVKNTHNCID